MVFTKVMKRGKDEPTRSFNGNCGNNNVTGVNIGTKEKGEERGLKKNANVSGEIHKKKKSDGSVNKASERGCLGQFGFQSQSSSLNKAKKEDLPNTEITFKVQDASEVEQSTLAEVFPKSSELEKRSQTAMNTNECESSSGIGFPCFHG